MGYVYKITNLINNKIYVGITTGTIESRWNNHKSEAYNINNPAYNCLFKKAIRKYGEKNFKVEQVDEAKTTFELKEKEIYWIAHLNSYAFDKNGWGYNMTRGGDSGSLKPVVQYNVFTGEKIKEFNSVKEAACEVENSNSQINRLNRKNKDYCFFFKEETEGLSEEKIKEKLFSMWPNLICQLDLKGKIIKTYRTAAEAERDVGCSRGSISKCLNHYNGRRTVAGFQWRYLKDTKERINKPVREIKVKTNAIAVTQYNLNGEKIKVWESAAEAGRDLNIQSSHISECCKLQRVQTGGYQWRYTDENIEKLDAISIQRKVICLETGEIFKNSSQAAKHFGYGQPVIKRCCNNEKTTKPYHFAWYDKDDNINENL